MAEDAIEAVEIALVLHQRRARQIIEFLDAPAGEVLVHRLHERQIFAQRDRHAGLLQLGKEGRKHLCLTGVPRPKPRRQSNAADVGAEQRCRKAAADSLRHAAEHRPFECRHAIDYSQSSARQHRPDAALDDRLIHRVQRCAHGAKAIVQHVGLVAVDRIDQRPLAAIRRRQCAAQPHGVLERHIGADAAIGRHRMDGVAEKRDALRRPRRDRHGGADREAVDGGRVGELHQIAKALIPRPRRHRLEHDLAKFVTRHLLGIAACKTELFAPRAERPHQIAARIVEMRAGREPARRCRRCHSWPRRHLLQRDEKAVDRPCADERHAVEQFGRERSRLPPSRKTLPAIPTTPVSMRCGMRQKLAPHARAAPVGGDQHVALGRCAIREMRDDPPAGIPHSARRSCRNARSSRPESSTWRNVMRLTERCRATGIAVAPCGEIDRRTRAARSSLGDEADTPCWLAAGAGEASNRCGGKHSCKARLPAGLM